MQAMETSSEGDYIPPALTAEEEDALIHLRILSEERALRKVVRKFYSYAFATEPGGILRGPNDPDIPIEEAREQLLAEIATFNMNLQKSALVCQAEARQVLEYEKEKERILKEQEATRQEIEELRVTLDEEEKFRRQKVEYDKIAEKINTFSTRAELQASIKSIQEEIVTIQEEKYHKERMMHARKVALDQIVSSLELLRQMDKEPELEAAPAEAQAIVEEEVLRLEDGEDEDREDSRRDRERERQARDQDDDGEEDGTRSGTPLNPTAKPFHPRSRVGQIREGEDATPSSSQAPSGAPSPRTSKAEEGEEGEEHDDIEMGEVSEGQANPGQNSRKITNGQLAKAATEELEEGEASDGGSLQAGPPGS
ncbi:hypothetical protein M422DRAFT_23165 [Sphaerobolus stellatus SS14]|nr:hypothetical protein M422DRAFT_23165 [Sphaerobolus stellatus SS14]